ncbi:hypothetical protein [Streptococcus equi]|uniref:hypothetical protein n=1 Tax=Streptococcus equi TaxID=1336 RepID=UPI001E514B3A|nr:hypothetical protein [Streptococcus equi]
MLRLKIETVKGAKPDTHLMEKLLEVIEDGVRIKKLSTKQKDIIRRPFNYELEVNEGTPRSGKTTAGIFVMLGI